MRDGLADLRRTMTPEEIRQRLPGAPEEAIRQLIALDKQHREILAHVRRGGKDFTDMVDYFERVFNLVQRWNPTKLEAVFEDIVDTFGRIICKGDEACIKQFEQTLRKLIKLGDIK
jgi:hypothetical protein